MSLPHYNDLKKRSQQSERVNVILEFAENILEIGMLTAKEETKQSTSKWQV